MSLRVNCLMTLTEIMYLFYVVSEKAELLKDVNELSSVKDDLTMEVRDHTYIYSVSIPILDQYN